MRMGIRVHRKMLVRLVVLVGVASASMSASARAQAISDTVTVHLTDVDLRAAVQLLGQYLDRPVVIGAIPQSRVTIETPVAVRRREVIGLLRATLQSQNLELVADSAGPYRIQAKEQPHPPVVEPPKRPGEVQLFTIRLKHARASDVAATVNALYGRASAFGEKAAPTSGSTLSQQLQQNVVPSNSAASPSSNSVSGAQNATLSGETTIVPDAGTNSLLIRASPSDFALIDAAVKELDVRPLQVLIEVLIAEVSHSRTLDFGLDVSVPPTSVPGHPNTTIDGSQEGADPGIGGLVLHVMGIGGNANVQATLQAAASRGDVSIVSRPAVLAVNNEEAEINVGSQRPFVQVSRSLPTDSPTRDQVVEYKDVGTKLSVRPTISADGYVMLQVTQEVSQATTEVAFDAPVISTRSVQTQLLLKDGQTVVIGGLTDRQHDVTQTGIPFLSSIPIIGGLFGHAERQTTETELFLFITPRIVSDDDGMTKITEPAQKKAGIIRE